MRSRVEASRTMVTWTVDGHEFFIHTHANPRFRIDFMHSKRWTGPLPIAQYDRRPHGRTTTYYHDRTTHPRQIPVRITKFQ